MFVGIVIIIAFLLFVFRETDMELNNNSEDDSIDKGVATDSETDIYLKSELIDPDNSELCYEQRECTCEGVLDVAPTRPVLTYECDGVETCSDEVIEKCFDADN